MDPLVLVDLLFELLQGRVLLFQLENLHWFLSLLQVNIILVPEYKILSFFRRTERKKEKIFWLEE